MISGNLIPRNIWNFPSFTIPSVKGRNMLKDRKEAGQLLSEKLEKLRLKKAVVYAIPRGGILTAIEIARKLSAPLDFIVTKKIVHPMSPEYAIGAVTESGQFIGNKKILGSIDEDWLEEEVAKKHEEAKERRIILGKILKRTNAKGKTAILVDDGVATGLSLRAAIIELKQQKPWEIIVAVPVITKSSAELIKKEVDKLVALQIPSDDDFLGAVGSYYKDFSQVTDYKIKKVIKSWVEEKDNISTWGNNNLIDLDEP